MKNIVFFLPLLFFVGCGGSDLTRVTGTVTLDGKPAVDATVMFVSDSGGPVCHGSTDISGNYTLGCQERVGVPPGAYSVKIKSRAKPVDTTNPMAGLTEGSPEYMEAYKKQMAGGGNRQSYKEKFIGAIPEKYDSGATLKATIGKSSQTVDFKLESK